MKTFELLPPELDNLVSLIERGHGIYEAEGDYTYRPSTDWSQGGPLIEKYLAGVERGQNEHEDIGWNAELRFPKGEIWEVWGPTPLIATMRAIVAMEYGETIDE